VAVPSWLEVLVVGGAYLLFLSLERLWPLRREVASKLRRNLRNLAMGGVSAAVIAVLQAPFLVPLAAWGEARHLGLLNLVAWPPALETAVGVLLLDYTLWHWHRWSHVVPFLWRFHLVHHADRDLDASTALRFHFGEMALSVPYRMAQVLLIGGGPSPVALWHLLLFVSILFHHSNTRLPARLDRALVKVLVTPRMHGIHHSNRREHTDSNWSSLLSAWDFVHRTAVLDVPQETITIGVPAYRDERDVTIGTMLALPFRRRPADWEERG
jgi:sterol desaturase/sphingolipid hydroxylase (fatty acid hydroxylase superfamily)